MYVTTYQHFIYIEYYAVSVTVLSSYIHFPRDFSHNQRVTRATILKLQKKK